MSGKPQKLHLVVDSPAATSGGADLPPVETPLERKKRQRREGMRRLRDRERKGEGLAPLKYTWSQVNRMVACGQLTDALASKPDKLRAEIGRIVSDLVRREFGE